MGKHTDFIDDDLSGSVGVGPDGMIDPIAARRAQSSNLNRMTEQRERLEDQVATTAQELERLRQKREDLETQKKSLEEIRKQQDAYLSEKKDMGQRIHQSLVLLEKEELRVAQLTELYGDTRRHFEQLQEKLDGMNEGNWEEDRFDEELSRSLDQLKATRIDFNKSLARLDALGWAPGQESSASEPEIAEESTMERGFVEWMSIGAAIGIPLAVLLGIAAILVHFALTKWLPV